MQIKIPRLVQMFFSVAFAMLILSPFSSRVLGQDRMTPEQIIAGHLNSLGSSEARRAAGGRIIFGTCEARFRGPRLGTLDGQAVLASEGGRSLIGIQFQSPDYPHEKMGFDGEHFRVGYLTPGTRTALGSFLLSNNSVFKEGLVGGALSTAWPFLAASERVGRMEYAGTEQINNRRTHKIRYTPRRGSDLQITLFFDAENFRHLRTLYERTVAPSLGRGGIDAQAGRRETRYRLVENFSEFRTAGRLTLPHRYEIGLSIDATTGTLSYNYVMNLQRFNFGQEIAPEFFNAEAS
jgi:hypothetical protein